MACSAAQIEAKPNNIASYPDKLKIQKVFSI
jgi:hypothetical protein